MKLKHSYKYNGRRAIMALAITLLIASCKKFVQIGPPSTEIATTTVLNNGSTATAALLAIYEQMFSNQESATMALNQGLLSDELTSFSTQSASLEFYTNSMQAVDNNGPWHNAYQYIYQANALVAGLNNNANIAAPIAQQIIAEAKFVRAFWYFYLVNMYGDVPLVTTPDYTINDKIASSPQAQVYNQMIEDLNDAKSMLNTNYVDATDTAITVNRVRPTKAAAEAMLARVYLYTQSYDSAEAQATLVINNTNLYSLCSKLSGPGSVFRMNSTEAIWQLGTVLPAGPSNTPDAEIFTLVAAPSTGQYNSATISPQLLNSFDSGDQRKVNWIGVYPSTNNPVVSYYFPYKYQSFDVSTLTEYTMVLRLAEQYLIRAESRAKQGNTSGAMADLNTIRTRAGLPPYSGATDTASILTAILHERQVELFAEWGHRWFDLIRTGAVNTVLGSPGNICQMKGGVWNSDWQLYPIPQTEILNDANLKQNPGY